MIDAFFIHDRFFIEAIYALRLEELLLDAYKCFFQSNAYNTYIWKDFPRLYKLIKGRIDESQRVLTVSYLCVENFMKH
jgi:hypothetical protein